MRLHKSYVGRGIVSRRDLVNGCTNYRSRFHLTYHRSPGGHHRSSCQECNSPPDGTGTSLLGISPPRLTILLLSTLSAENKMERY